MRHDAEIELHGKVVEIERILQKTYHVVRTISLLPGVRSTDREDVVIMGRMSASDHDTVQQLYNHIASSVDVSEIHIVYDGFKPQLGQVSFLIFDQVIVDRFEELSSTHARSSDADIPEED